MFILRAVPEPLAFLPSDLAPGDVGSAGLDLSGFRFDRIRAFDDPLFEAAYMPLWTAFGATNEMERRETLALRFKLAPRLLYEMILVRRKGEFIAVRDHTAIRTHDGAHAVVHLSHNLVSPSARRTGLAGWLRALPVQAGRECLANGNGSITLVAEMEYDDGIDPDRAIRLRAYEKAGFVKVDPHFVDYHQPDFRAPAEIDATGGPCPLRFQLIIRRVGREADSTILSRDIRTLIQALYDIYGSQFRPQDMAHPLLDLARLPAPETVVALVPPTQC
jgi:hypothetical protein